MSRKSKPNCCQTKGEALMQASAEFVRTYGAIVDALTATLMNAEAGLNWLSVQPPDLEEARRALNAIAKDGKRAGEIVVRLRAPIKGSSTAMSTFASQLREKQTSNAR